MPSGVLKLFEPLQTMPPAKRWMIAGVVAISALAFTILIVVTNKTDYRPVFANLSSEDAGEIVNKLKEQKIPYQIAADGKAILVPADKVYDIRLSLASEGLPQGSGVGFEIFDRKNFGMTEFVQKLNYQRALQGELARTINQLSGVEQARVHLAIPEKSLFKEEERFPTASVVLRMKGNRTLRENDVQGIVHLVSAAVEGMNPDHVTVLDSRGKVLSKGNGSDPASKMTSTMLETQRGYEKNLEERLQSLLDRAVGSGKSAARVTALFDFRQVEKLEEKYDPETTAVRSEQRTEEKNGSSTTVGGVPGAQANLGRTAPAAGGSVGGGSKSDETLNYEVSRMTARTVEPVGTLNKLSVAILVDGKNEAATAKGGTAAKAKYTPRSPEELQKIEALVKSAVGFNAERGDQVTVVNIPFQDAGMEQGDEGSGWQNSPLFMAVLKNGLIGAGFLLLIILVIRPLLTMVGQQRNIESEFLSVGGEEVKNLIGQQRNQVVASRVSQNELLEVVKKEPYQTAQVLQNWLRNND